MNQTSNFPSSNQNPVSSETETDSRLESLAKNIRSSALGENDDLAEALIKNWQKLVGALGVVLLCFWVVKEYRQAQQAKVYDSVSRFSEAQNTFGESFTSAVGDKTQTTDNAASKDDSLKGLKESLDSVTTRFPGTVYADFSNVYAAVADIRSGNMEPAREKLRKLGAQSFQGLTTVTPRTALKASDLGKELAALVYVRSLEAEGNTEARTRALEIARGAGFVNVEALLIAARLSKTDAEKQEVVSAGQEVIKIHPELADILKRELKSVGLSV